MKVEARDAGYILKTDAFARSSGMVYVFSVAGPSTHIKSFAAILNSDVRAAFRFPDVPNNHIEFQKFENGYRVWRTRLGYNCWHAVAVAKCEGLLLSVSDESVWRELRSERFTTPVIRDWMPHILSELRRREKLTDLLCWGCNAGMLTADSRDLDEIVSQGLKKNHLRID